MKILLLIATSAFIFSSCANKQKVEQVHVPIYHDKIVKKGTDAVYHPQIVEAYPISRYVDPNNKDLMHERHLVYKTTKRGWKLNSDPSDEIRVGAVAGLKDARWTRGPQASELNSVVVGQRNQLDNAEAALNKVSGRLGQITALAPQIKTIADEQNRALFKDLENEKRLRQLEADNNKLKEILSGAAQKKAEEQRAKALEKAKKEALGE